MGALKEKFKSDGYIILNDVFTLSEVASITNKCEQDLNVEVGTRNLLEFAWVRELALKIQRNDALKPLLPKNSQVIQCNYFNKDFESNWFVTLHRDLSVPVKRKLNVEGWSGWSVKEGITYVQPPREILNTLLAVRVHLEDNNSENGALQLVPKSHVNDDMNEEKVLCEVNCGGVLVMRPLLLHASSKSLQGKRRVLHFVFAPPKLPNGLEWAF